MTSDSHSLGQARGGWRSARGPRRWVLLSSALGAGILVFGLAARVREGRLPAAARAVLDLPALRVDALPEALPAGTGTRQPGGLELPSGPAQASATTLTQGAPTRDYLARYYGEDWPEIETKIEAWAQANGFDLDLGQPYYQRPWEEVEGEIAASLPISEEARQAHVQTRLQWPERLSASYVREHYPLGQRRYELDESDLVAIEALVAPKNEEITQLVGLFTERIDRHVMERWATGRYLRAPFTTGGLSDTLGFHSTSTGGHGWAITITLTREECPDVVEIEREFEDKYKERDRLVVAYLADKAPR